MQVQPLTLKRKYEPPADRRLTFAITVDARKPSSQSVALMTIVQNYHEKFALRSLGRHDDCAVHLFFKLVWLAKIGIRALLR